MSHPLYPDLQLTQVVAVSENFCMGNQGALPWHIPEDLKKFKALTTGHSMVMGRKTYESIGRPLPGRLSVVLSRKSPTLPKGVALAKSFEEALSFCDPERWGNEVFIIGGQAIFNLTAPMTDRIVLTRIPRHVDGDCYFNRAILSLFQLTHSESYETNSAGQLTTEDWRRSP